MRMSDCADSMLIGLALRGEESAFAELVGRYQAAVWRTVHRTLGNFSEGEDAVQEIFLRTLVSLHKFDHRYPFGPWILRIATNYCIDQLRRRKTRKYKLWSDLSEAEEERLLRTMSCNDDTGILARANLASYAKIAQSLLDQLKPRRRAAFVLREMEGRSYEEVAGILGIPEVTARVRVSRARVDLQKRFRKHLAGLKARGVQ